MNRFHCLPRRLANTPSRAFADLASAVLWAGRAARQHQLSYSVWAISAGGRPKLARVVKAP